MSILREFLRNPAQVGAIAASSPALARCIVEGIGLESAAAIVEYGAGTGAFTREIVRRKRPDARYCAFEMNERLAGRLGQAFPGVHISNRSVEKVSEVLDGLGIPRADCIVSGLPWAIFPETLQIDILTATTRILDADGAFATFAYIHGVYLPAGARFRNLLGRFFGSIERSPIVWPNLPPAFVYRCRQPLAFAAQADPGPSVEQALSCN
jgi:phospholipid N-methyltransferase